MLHTHTPQTPTARIGGWDLAGVVLSGICLLHCTLLPLLLALLPVVGAHYHGDERLHMLVTVLVVPVAVLALALGFRRHGQAWIPALGALGLVLILAAPVYHETLGELLEGAVTAVGGLGLVAAHLANRRASREEHAAGCC